MRPGRPSHFDLNLVAINGPVPTSGGAYHRQVEIEAARVDRYPGAGLVSSERWSVPVRQTNARDINLPLQVEADRVRSTGINPGDGRFAGRHTVSPAVYVWWECEPYPGNGGIEPVYAPYSGSVFPGMWIHGSDKPDGSFVRSRRTLRYIYDLCLQLETSVGPPSTTHLQ